MDSFKIFKLKVIHLESSRYSAESLNKLRNHVELICVDVSSQNELELHLENNKYEVIFTRLGLMLDESLLAAQPNIQFIVTSTTGLNHIDLDYCYRFNIQVVSLRGESSFLASIKSTAEHTWMLILALVRNFPQSHLSVLKGEWQREPFMASELDGKTIGIIGFGRLGKILAKYAAAFGMDVLIHDKVEFAQETLQGAKQVSLDYLLQNSNIVSLLISYSKENENFLNRKAFESLRPGAYLVNTSRGELLNEADLIAFLESGRIKAAALDVMNGDSGWSNRVSEENILVKYARLNKNLIITPHMGGYGYDSIIKTRDFVTNKFLKLSKYVKE
jgi:D-3-phosphoglycerate dehydrogenase